MTKLKQADALKLLSRHGKMWRQIGATTMTIEVVRCYFNLKAKGHRVTFAGVARCLGVHRSVVTRHMTRAEQIKMVFKIGRGVMLNIKSLIRWGDEARKRIRHHLKALNQRKTKRLSGCDFKPKPRFVDTVSTHTVPKGLNKQNKLNPYEMAQSIGVIEGYIPVHLRNSK